MIDDPIDRFKMIEGTPEWLRIHMQQTWWNVYVRWIPCDLNVFQCFQYNKQ